MFKNKKPLGIYNGGGWNCYINSVLQSISNTKFLNNFINYYSEDDKKIIEGILKFNLKFSGNISEIKKKCDTYLEKKEVSYLKKTIDNEKDDPEFIKEKISTSDLNLLDKIHNKCNYFFPYICLKKIHDKIINNEEQTIDPNEFIQVCGFVTQDSCFNSLFIGNQNDPCEFLSFLFDLLHECKSKKININFNLLEENCDENKIINLYKNDFKKRFEKEYSIYVEHVLSYTLKNISCNNCEYKNYVLSPEHILSLPLPKQNSISIFDCLNDYTKKQKLDNDYKCDHCKETHCCFIENGILTESKLLIFQLLRFEHNNFNYVKNTKKVDFPLNLNLTDYILKNNSNNYKLNSIILHFGGMNGGHYISCIRRTINNSDTWFICDDQTIKETNESFILNHPNTYLLFYEIEDN